MSLSPQPLMINIVCFYEPDYTRYLLWLDLALVLLLADALLLNYSSFISGACSKPILHIDLLLCVEVDFNNVILGSCHTKLEP